MPRDGRGRVGQFHEVSEKHLDRYADEFTWRPLCVK
jgi:hypothetical protein